MPSAVASAQREQPNYDQDVDDFMQDLGIDSADNNGNIAPQDPPKDIDEEVQVKKKRKPNPKLDEARLLSNNGIPKLRRLTKSKLRFRGKGHEYADITALLNMYQLWLDDLYPKAKFKDGLTMVEKVGHSKRMQITRRAWLDATKPLRRDDSPERVGNAEMSGGLGDKDGEAGGGASRISDDEREEVFGDLGERGNARMANDASGHENAPEDEKFDARLDENTSNGTSDQKAKPPPAKGPFEEDSDPEEDELDALMAEEEAADAPTSKVGTSGSRNAPDRSNERDDFADDEEAMASMGW